MRPAVWVVIALAAALAGGPARADEAEWAVAGKTVLRLHGLRTGMTAQQRVEQVDQRANEILSGGDGTLNISDIVLKQDDLFVTIEVRGTLLVTVAQEDADANHMTREKLGRVWLANLHRTLPQLAPRENKHGA